MRTSHLIWPLALIGLTPSELPARERITVELKMGEGVSCNELRTPSRWTVPPYDRQSKEAPIFLPEYGFMLNHDSFELRQGARLLLGVVAKSYARRARTPLYSPDVYAIVHQKTRVVLEHAPQ